ncbi:MAG TPA: hypothetical protein VFK69_12405 [Candidatus Eisenbacteria bacterium]|nr:hypothetical protein [Candidatus Eisenbacteria bacterium]
MKRVFGVLCMLVVAGAATAAPPQKGSTLFALQIGETATDLVDLESGGYLTSANFVAHPDLTVSAQLWHFLTNDYAVSLGGGIGFFSETDKPGSNAPPASPDLKYTQSSWRVRLGGDRWGTISDRFQVFAGPGIQVSGGKWKFDDGTTTTTSQNTTVFALEGRIGAHLRCGDRAGIVMQLGHYIGYASASSNGAKTHWWASGHDGSAGLAITF